MKRLTIKTLFTTLLLGMLPTNFRGSAPVRLTTNQGTPGMPMVNMPQGNPVGQGAATSVRPTAGAPKEHAVRMPETDHRYGVMEFASGIVIDCKDGNKIEMKREINPYTYRPATVIDSAGNASNTIVTASGAVLPKTGAGSEYGREQKEAMKKRRYATKGTNAEDLPWVLTNYLVSEKRMKHYRGIKKGGITDNSSYYIFIQQPDGFSAFPVEDWHSFTPTNVFKTLDYDEAEKQYDERHKKLSKWVTTHMPTKGEHEESEETPSSKKGSRAKLNDFKLLDTDDFNFDNDEDDDDEDDDGDSDKKKSSSKKSGKKSKSNEPNLSDDDEDEAVRSKLKQKKNTQKRKRDEQAEDSDDGDHEEDEIDYTTDASSEEEDDIRDKNTVKSSMKYEAKGIDEEMKTMPNIEKKIEQMDEYGDEIDFEDDDDEEIPDIEENDDENRKENDSDDFGDVGKLLKNDAISKEIGSSSDDDDMDDSDDPDKDNAESTSAAMNLQPVPSQQVKTEKGHKKAKEEEIRALKSQVISMSSSTASSSEPRDTITEEKVRSILARGQLTSTELIQKFLPKAEHQRTKELKQAIVERLAVIIKQIPVDNVKIDNKTYMRLRETKK